MVMKGGKSVYLTYRQMGLIWDAMYATRGKRGTYTATEAEIMMKKMQRNNPSH